MSEHTIHWTHPESECDHSEDFCMPTASISCGATYGAECRMICVDCEEWSVCKDTGCSHPLGGVPHCDEGHHMIDAGHCNPGVYMDNSDVEECGPYPATPPLDGPVEYEWQGGYYTWRYAPTT